MEPAQFTELSAYMWKQRKSVGRDKSEIEKTLLGKFIQYVREHNSAFSPRYSDIIPKMAKYHPVPDNDSPGNIRFSSWLSDMVDKNSQPKLRLALIKYYWDHHPEVLRTVLKTDDPSHSAIRPFLDYESATPSLTRRMRSKRTTQPFPFSGPTSEYNARDWEIAKLRVKTEKVARTGRLDFSKLRIDSVPEEVQDFGWLRFLDLCVTPITSLPDLSGFSHLETLDCSYTMIDSLEGIGNPALHTLWCGVSNLTSVDGIEKCPNLKRLYLGSSHVSDLGPATGLPIEVLSCEDTGITEFSALAGSESLTYLEASDNKLRRLADLRECVSLRHIVLNGCTVDEAERKLWLKPALAELVMFHGTIPDIPPNILSRSFDENCLSRVRDFLRRQPSR